MILFTTGHEQFQFDYLMRLVAPVRDEFPDEEIIVQYGHSKYIPAGQGIEAMGLLPSEKFREAVCNARVVVSHCGEGNLLLLQELGTPFVLVPRTKRRKEHVDDHQLELAQVLENAGLPVAFDLPELLQALRNPRFVKYEFRDEKIAEVLTQRDLSGDRVLLVTSSGGHFQLMRTLARYWQSFPNRLWATFENKTTRTMLENEAVVWAHAPTNRNIPNLIRNNLLAYRTIRSYRPDIILSTGAGVSVPFLLQGKLMGCRTVFVESITRVRDLSLSAKILQRLGAIGTLVVQHHELGKRYPEAVVVE
jgi:UDP-N-acetylglucosamine transferase subunit ALG13